jgi:alkylation response protein AidB-like acyl-CoA dehydrogenase
VSVDLAFDDAQQAIADTLTQFCVERCPDEEVKALEGRFPDALWRELGELGVLALMTPHGDGGAVELVAACEALGRGVFPGPVPAVFFATQVLPGPECERVAAGEQVASVGAPPLFPWAPHAGLFIALEGERAWLCEPRGAVEPVETLGGEPWGRVEVERRAELAGVARARVVYETALAATLAGAGLRLVEDTAEHVRTRKQFGRAIGEFQAVAHPLAAAHIDLVGVQALARAAAWSLDEGGEAEARATAAAAGLAARRAAVAAAHTCHQLFGAVGITNEGPVFHVTRRIRQLASELPGSASSRDALLHELGL